MTTWTYDDAQSQLEDLIDQAERDGPQFILDANGTLRSVMLSISEFNLMSERQPTLREHLLGGPKFDDFEVERDEDSGRDIDLSDLDVSEYRRDRDR